MKKDIQFFRLALIVCFIVLYLFPLALLAQDFDWIWARQAGGNSYNSGREIVADGDGNVYVTGFFQGVSAFGDHTITSQGGFDIFVAKYNSDGEALWAAGMGGASLDYGISLDVDADQNVYLTGYFGGTMNTDAGTVTAVGIRDVFVAKYNAEGQLQWIKSAGGPHIDQGEGLIVDQNNQRIYVTGRFMGTLTFSGTDVTLQGAGSDDIFVAAYDFDGDLIWARSAVGPGSNIAFSIGADAAGNVYGGGSIGGVTSFGDIQVQNIGINAIVLFKLDIDGNWLWANAYGGNLAETVWSMVVQPDGETWAAGIFASNSVQFGDHTVIGDGQYYSVFIIRQNADGFVQWASSGGSTSHDYARGVAVDNMGNSYITGNFHHIATFGDHSITTVDNTDAYIVKYSPEGVALWAVGAGGTSTDIGDAIAVDGMGNVYITGYFYNNISFGDITLNTITAQDIFIAKLYDEMAAPQFVSVTGRAIDEDMQPVEGVLVSLPDISIQATTGEDGIFTLENIPANQSYLLSLGHIAYFSYETTIEVELEDLDLGDIILNNAILPVSDVLATAESTYAHIEWQAPDLPKSGPAELQSYTIFRMAEQDIDLPDNWTQIADDVTNAFLLDHDWFDLDPGEYAWAIVAVYSHDLMAEPVVSNILILEEDDNDVHVPELVNKQFHLYPNPATDRVTITGNHEITKIRIYDSFGKLVISEHYGSRSVVVDLHGLTNGIYVFRIFTSGNRNYSKIVQIIRCS